MVFYIDFPFQNIFQRFLNSFRRFLKTSWTLLKFFENFPYPCKTFSKIFPILAKHFRKFSISLQNIFVNFPYPCKTFSNFSKFSKQINFPDDSGNLDSKCTCYIKTYFPCTEKKFGRATNQKVVFLYVWYWTNNKTNIHFRTPNFWTGHFLRWEEGKSWITLPAFFLPNFSCCLIKH